jgi:hypothetical protein
MIELSKPRNESGIKHPINSGNLANGMQRRFHHDIINAEKKTPRLLLSELAITAAERKTQKCLIYLPPLSRFK